MHIINYIFSSFFSISVAPLCDIIDKFPKDSGHVSQHQVHSVKPYMGPITCECSISMMQLQGEKWHAELF